MQLESRGFGTFFWKFANRTNPPADSMKRLDLASKGAARTTIEIRTKTQFFIAFRCVYVTKFLEADICRVLTSCFSRHSPEVSRMATQVRDQLLASNEVFRKLAEEHSQYSQRLDTLVTKRYLSEEEKLEEVRLKKLKLRLKDQMESLEQQFRKAQPVA